MKGALEGNRMGEAKGSVAVVELRGGYIELPPLRGLAGDGWSAQTWVRPRGVAGTQTLIDLEAGGGRIVLVLRHDQVALEISVGERRLTIGAAQAVGAGRWTHVGASLDRAGGWAIFVAGRRAAGGKFTGLTQSQLAAALDDELRTGGRLGRGVSGEAFTGCLAEVRLWRRALAESELSAGPGGRCRGDEPGLVACYRLDALDGDALADIAGGQAHARRVGAVEVVGADLPLAATDGRGLSVRARLVRDHLPLAVFPADRALVPACEAATDLRAANAATFGDVAGGHALCSLYDAAIEVRRGGAAASGAELQASVDRDAWVLVEDAGLSLARWTAGATQTVRASATGRVRLRVLAGDALAGPVLRVRGPDGPADAWTVVRPGDEALARLHLLTGDDLSEPEDGPSPLAADSDAADAEALASLLSALASALPIDAPADEPAEDVSFGLEKSLKKGLKKAKKGAKDVGKRAEKEAKKVEQGAKQATEDVRKVAESEWTRVKHRASAFVIDGAAEVAALIERGRKVTAEVGPSAIRRRLAEARRLAAATVAAGAVRGTVELVGTTIVDKVEQPWRVVVAGVADVVAAVEALAVRVGAELRRLIDLLADLFGWQKYLAACDRLYASCKRAMNDQQARSGEFTGLVDALRELVARPIAPQLADKTLGQVLGVRPGKLRAIDDLDRILDYAQRLLSSGDVDVKGREAEPVPDGASIAAEAAEGPGEAASAAVPKDIFSAPDAVFDRPLAPLMAFPGQVYRICAPVLEPSLRAIEGAIPATMRAAERTITGRLTVPVLTDLIEATILGGRSLDVLRVVCLLGAILQVTLEAGERALSFGGDDRAAHDLEWVAAGLGLANSIVVLVRAGDEHLKGARWAGVLFATNAALTAAQSAIGFAYAGVVGGPAMPYMITQSTLDLLLAGWYGVMASAYLQASGPLGAKLVREYTAGPDLVVELTLGGLSIVTTIVAYSVKTADNKEFGAAIGLRFASWTFRGLQRVCDGLDNNASLAKLAAPASAVFAALGVVTEFTAGMYAIGVSADEET
jgi:hypothetical protein